MRYHVFIPHMDEGTFREITEDILPDVSFERAGFMSHIIFEQERDVVMLKLALPQGWRISGIYLDEENRSVLKRIGGDGDDAIEPNRTMIVKSR